MVSDKMKEKEKAVSAAGRPKTTVVSAPTTYSESLQVSSQLTTCARGTEISMSDRYDRHFCGSDLSPAIMKRVRRDRTSRCREIPMS